jgi:hypothetical protein
VAIGTANKFSPKLVVKSPSDNNFDKKVGKVIGVIFAA